MKALQVVAPGEARLVEVPTPEVQPTEVLLKVRFVGMCGSDLNTFRGRNPLVTYPRVLGHEISATVADVTGADGLIEPGVDVMVSPYFGCGVCNPCRRGRPNACPFNRTLGVQRDGAMAELIAVPPAKLLQAPGLTLEELALVEPLSIGFHAVARARITAQDIVAVFGCGGVGIGAVAGAARRGATVIAIDVEETKLSLCKSAGAALSINSQSQPLHATLQEFTGGRGPDVVIEAIGLPATFQAAVEEVAYTGRVVYIGWAKEPVTYETRLFLLKELDVMGSRNATTADFHAVIEMLQQKQFPVDRAISKVVPLADAAAALAQWSAAPGSFQKIMVRIDG